MESRANQSAADQHCSGDQLRRVLDDALSESEERGITAHLSDCDSCRAQLESLAADETTWTRAAGWLSSQSERVFRSGDTAGFHESSPAEDDAYDADFAVQFLSPGTTDGSLGRLGEIDIREFIGRGAMGIVLKGWQAELNRFVAVKVMSPYLAVSGAARRRFEREAQAAAAILHPNVMPIHSVSSTARLPYLVMPFLSCESLQERVNREGPLPLIEQLQIAVQVARGLAAAHAQGLVHRDVKPANILLEMGVDRVMLTDFGLARAVDDASLTRSGVIAGTPQYMSPEQAGGDPIDQRSDLFSFGSVMYCMATGRAPFRAESSYGILRRLCESTPRSIREINSDAPVWLAVLIERLQERDRDVRIQSAAEVAEILEQCLAHVRQPDASPIPVACVRHSESTLRSTSMRSTFVGSARKHAWKAVIAMVAVTVVGGLIWSRTAGWFESETDGPSEQVHKSQLTAEPTAELEMEEDIAGELESIRQRIQALEDELQRGNPI